MIFDASTSFASTRRSAPDSFDRSAPISVGANRAAIRSSRAASGTSLVVTRASCARTAAMATAAASSMTPPAVDVFIVRVIMLDSVPLPPQPWAARRGTTEAIAAARRAREGCGERAKRKVD